MSVIDLLALCRAPGVVWHFIAREAQRPDGISRLLRGRASEQSADAIKSLEAIVAAHADLPRLQDESADIVARAMADSISLTTVLDDTYPSNLRSIYNLPPFLFYRGELRDEDARAVAVVGSRTSSADGIRRARRLSRALAHADVTVLSGLARGIDTAAHDECVNAVGRTIAVLGSGIRRVYPPENAALADRIAERGAVVSQFWPDAPPASYNFPRRNVVTSGLGQGTVVVEATATSGAKMQARLALEHGKRVFLLASLVDTHEWARRYVKRGAIRVDSPDDILRFLRSPESVRDEAVDRKQLVLDVF